MVNSTTLFKAPFLVFQEQEKILSFQDTSSLALKGAPALTWHQRRQSVCACCSNFWANAIGSLKKDKNPIRGRTIL